MWVPLVENNEHLGEGADYFIKQNIENIFQRNSKIDTLLLGCTHYPLLAQKIRKFLPPHVRLVSQGEIVADSLKNYLQRHPEIEERLSKGEERKFFTTDSREDFDDKATVFFGRAVESEHAEI